MGSPTPGRRSLGVGGSPSAQSRDGSATLPCEASSRILSVGHAMRKVAEASRPMSLTFHVGNRGTGNRGTDKNGAKISTFGPYFCGSAQLRPPFSKRIPKLEGEAEASRRLS